MPIIRKTHPQRPDRGFTLVEVLVSLVVLSVGLLGMAKLVLVSSHSNDSAYLRSQAAALAYQIVDNMRANVGSATSKGYDIAMGTLPAAPTSCVGVGACSTAAQVAAYDLWNWENTLQLTMPGGSGSVATSTTVPVTATVTVRWDDSAAQCAFGPCTSGQPVYQTFTIQTALQ